MTYVIHSDGGRALAGFPCPSTEGDCAVRAICNTLGRNDLYGVCRDCCIAINATIAPKQLPAAMRNAAGRHLTHGVASEAPAFKELLTSLGFVLTDYYEVWRGLANPRLEPWSTNRKGRWLVVMQDHMTAWVDGTWVDAFDPHLLPSAAYGVYQAWELKGL